MANETFDIKRFGKYFRYDLGRLWNNNGQTILLLGGLSLTSYLVHVVFPLITTGLWHAPSLSFRFLFFYFGIVALVLCSTRTYGYITEKKSGQAWLLTPASVTEKFLSMMIISIVVMPLSYIISYLLLDALICLADSTAGSSLLLNFCKPLMQIKADYPDVAEGFRLFEWPHALAAVVFQLESNILFFLLCGICFRRWKIAGGVGIIMFLGIVIIPLLSRALFNFWNPGIYGGNAVMDDPSMLIVLVNRVFTYGLVFNVILTAGLAAGVFWRIKTLKR